MRATSAIWLAFTLTVIHVGRVNTSIATCRQLPHLMFGQIVELHAVETIHFDPIRQVFRLNPWISLGKATVKFRIFAAQWTASANRLRIMARDIHRQWRSQGSVLSINMDQRELVRCKILGRHLGCLKSISRRSRKQGGAGRTSLPSRQTHTSMSAPSTGSPAVDLEMILVMGNLKHGLPFECV